jgi:hypothetical protein
VGLQLFMSALYTLQEEGARLNLFFHLASALATILILAWVLRLKAQRDLLRLLLEAAGGARRVRVESPLAFLKSLAQATGVPLEVDGDGPAPAPARIEARPVSELFLAERPALIRWKMPNIVEIHTVKDTLPAAFADRLGEALGGRVSVKLIAGATRPSP